MRRTKRVERAYDNFSYKEFAKIIHATWPLATVVRDPDYEDILHFYHKGRRVGQYDEAAKFGFVLQQ